MKHTQLALAFENVSGASFVGIDTLTEVKLTGGASNPQKGRVTKRMTGAQVMVFSNQKTNGYQEMIKRRLIHEGKDPATFDLKPRQWGTRVPNLPLIEHEKEGVTTYYLEVIFLKKGLVEYRLDGRPIDKKDIVGLVEKEESEQAELENKVIIRSFLADSITEVRVDGRVFN